MLTGLDLLFLEVNNLQDSVDFYRLKLGFEVETANAEAEPPMATLRAGRLRLMLAEQPLTMARRGRGVHFFVGVGDVDAYYEQLCACAVEVATGGRGLGRALRHARRPRPLSLLLRHVARRRTT